MRDKTKRLSTRAALATAVALCVPAFAATGAASAAQWAELTSPPSAPASVEGVLSVQRGTYVPVINPPVTCPVNSYLEDTWAQNGIFAGEAQILSHGSFETCANGKPFSMALLSGTSSTGSMTIAAGGAQEAPFNGSAWSYSQRAVTVPVINGAGGTKTQLVFNNTLISDTGQGTQPAIYATGNLEITSPSGGTYTLIP